MTPPGAAAGALPALVLAAGLGTRLEPLTSIRAKAAVPVNGDTLARRVIRWLVSEGIRDLVLNLHHLPASITASVGDGSDLGARVRYSWEQSLLGSAGGPRHALPLLGNVPAAHSQQPAASSEQRGARSKQPFLIVNGDTLTDVPLRDMVSAHVASGALVTMALIRNPRPDKYGGVVVSNEGWVTGFTRAGSVQPSYHFVGVQMAEPRAFESLSDGVPSETVNGIYRQMIATDPHAIAAFVCEASFRDIGTPADYLDTSLHLAAVEGNRLASGSRMEIDPTASVVRTAIWDDVSIGAGAELIECIVGDGAVVPSGAAYQRCTILPAQDRALQSKQWVDGNLLIAAF
jgi:mannose-1-phosphate guanylyltransferase